MDKYIKEIDLVDAIEWDADLEVWTLKDDDLENFPAADVAPVVHGRWIYGEDIDIQCSVCGADALTEGDYRQVKSRYCPNCGAKMDLED